MRSTLAGLAETGSETAQRLEGFASVRSTLAGVAETGSETAQRLGGLFSSTHPPLPRSPLSHKRGLIKIKSAALPHLFSSIFSLLS